jgi:uncharacterized membrane protein YraQ (UPF0718 family)
MSDLTVRRWAGASGVAAFVVFVVALPLYFGGMTNAPLEEAERFPGRAVRGLLES